MITWDFQILCLDIVTNTLILDTKSLMLGVGKGVNFSEGGITDCHRGDALIPKLQLIRKNFQFFSFHLVSLF